MGVVLLLIFFLIKKSTKGHKGEQKEAKKAKKRGERIQNQRKREKEEGKKKIFEKKKIQLCCLDEREEDIHFQPTKFLSRPNDLSWPSTKLSLSSVPTPFVLFF